jgi:hypoxanthine phosphoribosyltransferase
VATGHTASDQAETLLLNLVRGAGTAGLAGMAPARPLAPGVALVRPLLAISRRQTEAYCAELGLAPLEDASNCDLAFRRNLVRHRLLPLLRELNPRVEEALVRTAMVLRLDEAALAGRAADLPLRDEGDALAIGLGELRSAPAAVRVRVLGRAARRLGGGELGAAHIAAWLRSLAPGFRGEVELPGGLVWSVEQGMGYLRAGRKGPSPCPVPLALDGRPVRFGTWRVTARPVAARRDAGPEVAHVDADRLEGPLVVRARRPGDRFRPLGMGTTKRLQDFLVDARVPRSARAALPLVVCGEQIVWVAGLRLDERFKVTAATRRLVRLERTLAQKSPLPKGGGIERNIMDEGVGEVLIEASAIERRVSELGAELSEIYAGQEILLVGVLKGAVLFMVDLARALTVPVVLDFMAVSSYGTSTRSSGIVRILKDLEESVEGRQVLLAEDIVDSGLTLSYLVGHLAAQNPASLRVVTLLEKRRARSVPVQIDYVGFKIPDVFVIGYGLDASEHYRNLPFIARYNAAD